MPSPFELSLQAAVRSITRSSLARVVLYRQGATDTANLSVAWREGDFIGDERLAGEAIVLVSDLPKPPQKGDVIESENKRYEVARVNFDGVGGARVGFRLERVLQQ